MARRKDVQRSRSCDPQVCCCISYFSHCYDQISDLKDRRVCLAHSLSGCNPSRWERRGGRCKKHRIRFIAVGSTDLWASEAADHIASVFRKQRNTSPVLSSYFLLVFRPGHCPWNGTNSHLKWIFLTAINLTEKQSVARGWVWMVFCFDWQAWFDKPFFIVCPFLGCIWFQSHACLIMHRHKMANRSFSLKIHSEESLFQWACTKN